MFTSLKFETPYDPITGRRNYIQYDPMTDPHIFEFKYNKDLLDKCNKPLNQGIFSSRYVNGWQHNRNCNALYEMMKQKFNKPKSYTELQPKVQNHIMELFPQTGTEGKLQEQFTLTGTEITFEEKIPSTGTESKLQEKIPSSLKQNQIINATCDDLAIYNNEDKYHYEPYDKDKDPYIQVFANHHLLKKCNQKNYDDIPRWKRDLSCQGLYRLAQQKIDEYPPKSSTEKEKNKSLQSDLVKFYVSNLFCVDRKQTAIVSDIIADLDKPKSI
jgi:hypothetical protein